MVSFIRKRLQVFVSSTFTDLIHERQAAVEAILTAGHIPAGMELFTSGDESQMEVIKQWIDESDVYLLILAGRYGSVESKTDKSYTQLEYEYAVNQGKPLFACVITDSALNDRIKIQGKNAIETDNPQKLKDFRAIVLTKMVRFWEDSKDIKISIGETLAHFARRDDLLGWIRADQEANTPALADEIARLSKENAVLRKQIATMNYGQTMHGLSFHEAKAILKEKNILDLFICHAKDLAQSSVEVSAENDSFRELYLIGFVSIYSTSLSAREGKMYSYKLTNEGRVFLNRLQVERLHSNNVQDE